MAVTIPELILKTTVDGLLALLADDIKTNPIKENTLLYRIYGDSKYDKFNYYDQASAFFAKGNGKARKLRTKLAYDGDTSSPPIAYITTGSDSFNLAGIGRKSAEVYQDKDKRYNEQMECRFSSSSNIVIMSDSMEEVLLIYHTLRAMLIGAVDTLSLNGLENCRMGGADVSIDEDMTPKNLFIRALSLSYEYSIEVPSMIRNVNGALSITGAGLPSK